MANSWFRMYAEFLVDPKVQMMSEAYQRRLVALFCIRCNGSETFHETQIAFQLRISDDEWKATKDCFVGLGFIDSDNNILNWDKRQFISDSSTKRVKKYRETKVKRFRSVSVTPPDTDTDTDTDRYIVISDFQRVYDLGCNLFPSLMAKNTSEIHKWLMAGCDLDSDILQTIKASTGRDISTWTYFSRAIMNAKASRENPLPKGKATYVKQRQPSNTDRSLAAIFAAVTADSGNESRASEAPIAGRGKDIIAN